MSVMRELCDARDRILGRYSAVTEMTGLPRFDELWCTPRETGHPRTSCVLGQPVIEMCVEIPLCPIGDHIWFYDSETGGQMIRRIWVVEEQVRQKWVSIGEILHLRMRWETW